MSPRKFLLGSFPFSVPWKVSQASPATLSNLRFSGRLGIVASDSFPLGSFSPRRFFSSEVFSSEVSLPRSFPLPVPWKVPQASPATLSNPWFSGRLGISASDSFPLGSSSPRRVFSSEAFLLGSFPPRGFYPRKSFPRKIIPSKFLPFRVAATTFFWWTQRKQENEKGQP